MLLGGGDKAGHFMPFQLLIFKNGSDKQWQKLLVSFKEGREWQKLKDSGKKYQNFILFAMSFFATLSVSTPDFQKWKKWQVTKFGLPPPRSCRNGSVLFRQGHLEEGG